MMKIIILREKHGDMYLGPYASHDQVEDGAASIIRFRIKEGYWYDPNETMKALAAIEARRALEWLRNRSGEYEEVETKSIEPVLS